MSSQNRDILPTHVVPIHYGSRPLVSPFIFDPWGFLTLFWFFFWIWGSFPSTDLKLTPDLEACTFAGEVSVRLTVREATSSIALHSHEEITVSHGELLTSAADGGSHVAHVASGIEFDKSRETVTVRFDKEVRPGEATLNLKFKGILNDQMAGFYRSEYTVSGGATKRNMAATQFEATDARRAFPCWDEPSLKATFKV